METVVQAELLRALEKGAYSLSRFRSFESRFEISRQAFDRMMLSVYSQKGRQISEIGLSNAQANIQFTK